MRTSVLLLLLVAAGAAVATAEEENAEEEDEVARPTLFGEHGPPHFFDYDCDVANTKSGRVADWNEFYAYVQKTVSWNETDYSFPEAYRHLVVGPLAEAAENECPLGVLYLRVLLFYDAYHYDSPSHDEIMGKADYIQYLLRSFPVYAIALSRWPIFYVFDHFAPTHREQSKYFCDGEYGVLDWAALREKSNRWMDMKRSRTGPGDVDALEHEIGDDFFTILRKKESQNQAQEECEFGFHFLIANQVVAAAGRETHHLPPFNYIMDKIMSDIPFMSVAACGWPIFAVLVIFSDLNKGIWFFGGDRKYLRGYSDWNLRRDELSPLVPGGLDFLSPAWRAEAGQGVEALARLSGPAFQHEVRFRMHRREEADGEPIRPLVREIVEAALAVAAATSSTSSAGASGRRMAYVVLLHFFP